MLCQSGLLSHIVQSRHSVCFVFNSLRQLIRHCNRSCEIVGGSHVLNKVSQCFRRQCGVCFVKAVYCHVQFKVVIMFVCNSWCQ